MQRAVWTSTFFLISAATTAFADNPRDRWLDSFDAAQAEAKKTGKPIFLVFR